MEPIDPTVVAGIRRVLRQAPPGVPTVGIWHGSAGRLAIQLVYLCERLGLATRDQVEQAVLAADRVGPVWRRDAFLALPVAGAVRAMTDASVSVAVAKTAEAEAALDALKSSLSPEERDARLTGDFRKTGAAGPHLTPAVFAPYPYPLVDGTGVAVGMSNDPAAALRPAPVTGVSVGPTAGTTRRSDDPRHDWADAGIPTSREAGLALNEAALARLDDPRDPPAGNATVALNSFARDAMAGGRDEPAGVVHSPYDPPPGSGLANVTFFATPAPGRADRMNAGIEAKMRAEAEARMFRLPDPLSNDDPAPDAVVG